LQCTVARSAASELEGAGAGEEQAASALPKVVIADLKVGQELEGTVARHMQFGAFVNVGAEREGLVETEELSDGLPMKKLRTGAKVTARVLKVEDGKFWLTLRSGDLARPYRDISPETWKDIDLSPFAGIPADQWLDGEVHSIFIGRGVFISVKIPGTDKLAKGLLTKEEFVEGMVDNIHFGMKLRVRVLACDVEKGRLDFTVKDP